MKIVYETLTGAVVNGQWCADRVPYGFAHVVQVNGADMEQVISFVKKELGLEDMLLDRTHIKVSDGVNLL